MKKRVISMALVVALVLSMSMTAFARWGYTEKCQPGLTFSGTTAQCSLNIKANDSNAAITATLRLIRENKDGTETTVKTWTGLKGTGSLTFAGTHTVTSGLYYRLEVSATVKTTSGSEYPSEYVRAKCP